MSEVIQPANPTRIMEYSVTIVRTTRQVAKVVVFVEDVPGAMATVRDVAMAKADSTRAWSEIEIDTDVTESRQESTGEYLPKTQREWGSDVR